MKFRRDTDYILARIQQNFGGSSVRFWRDTGAIYAGIQNFEQKSIKKFLSLPEICLSLQSQLPIGV
jgi:hypothetical protein